MRFVTYLSPSTQRRTVGIVHGDQIIGDTTSATRLLELIRTCDLTAAGEQILAARTETVPAAAAQLCAPITEPPTFRDFMAFEGHVVNCNTRLGRPVAPVWYDQPSFYFSNPYSIRGPRDAVPVAPGSAMFDFELEIGAVIGKAGSDLAPDDAEEHIAGYVLLCDWSARDLQVAELGVSLGPVKGKDTATSLGPVLVTPDELTDRRRGLGYDLTARVTVNDTVIGEGNWADLYWSFGDMIAYASRGSRVVPGDLIGSGTIATCCLFEHLGLEPSSRWLTPGDRVTVEVERLGTIDTVITEGHELVPIPARGLRLPADAPPPGSVVLL